MSMPPPDQFPIQWPAERHPDSPPRGYGLVVAMILLGLILLLLVPYAAQQIAFSITRGQELARAEVATDELAKLPAQTDRYPLVVKIVAPSVVGIQTAVQVASPFGGVGWFEPELRGMAQGSGVIVDAAGYILTNAHVISQATPNGVTVQLSDGRSVPRATIVGVDPATDLAVLKIDAGRLSAARWGDSDALEVGNPVLAMGSPYGLTETVTAGIISAKNRKVGIENVRYEDFLQTDAAVNPGNSGGPLVNMKAEVVGINTAIVGHAYQGIGFAIPSNLAKQVYELLKTTGIPRGWIGVAMQDLTGPLAEKLGLKETHGALVAGVMDNSPAAEAGIKAGDVIVSWAGRPVATSNDLRIAAARTAPGAKVVLGILRDGQKREVSVTVGTRPSQIAQ
jgi:serine protease Do